MRLAILLIVICFCLRPISGQDIYFPPTFGAWQTVNPISELNWCQERLDSLQGYLADANTKAFIILKDGRIAVEWYFDSFTQDSVWYWASAGKTVNAALVGIAQEEGLLSIDEPTSTYLGEGWTSCSPAEEQAITVRHQLTMTTGLDDSAMPWECTEPECLECLTEPGTRWAYHNGPYTLLPSVVESAAGMTINQYFASRIGNKIGAIGAFIQLGYNRIFFSRPRDMARFGLLMLAEGDWNGTTVLGDSDYFTAMTTSSQSINPSYGYLWWLNGEGSYQLPALQFLFDGDLIPNAPDDLYAALGKNDQKIYVVPSEGLVVIRMGEAAAPITPALSGFDNELWGQIGALACLTNTGSPTDETFDFSLSPNPAVDQVQISTNQAIQQVELFDLTGRRLWVGTSTTIEMGTLPTGLYLVRLRTKDGRIRVRKLMKDGA